MSGHCLSSGQIRREGAEVSRDTLSEKPHCGTSFFLPIVLFVFGFWRMLPASDGVIGYLNSM
jgi:hypothetical protein